MSDQTAYTLSIGLSLGALIITAITVMSSLLHRRKMKRLYAEHRARMDSLYRSL